MPGPRKKEWLIRALLVIGSVGLLEGAARLLYHPAPAGGGDWHFEYDAGKSYRWKANISGVFGTKPFHTNSRHMADSEHEFAKPFGTRRLAVVGDSVAFGFNVDADKGFVPLLGRALGAETLNFGVPGYSTFQEYYDVLESRKYCPDLTLLQFSLNDLVEPFVYLERLGGLGIDYHRVPDASGLHFRLRSLSRLYELVSNVAVRSAVSGYGKDEMRKVMEREQEFNERALLEEPGSPRGRAAWGELHYWLHRIGEACAGNCAFLLSPSSVRFYHDGEKLEATLADLRRRAAAEGFLVLDPWPTVKAGLAKSGETDPVKKWNSLFLDDIHPNERGHELLARFLAGELRAILQRPPGICGGT